MAEARTDGAARAEMKVLLVACLCTAHQGQAGVVHGGRDEHLLSQKDTAAAMSIWPMSADLTFNNLTN